MPSLINSESERIEDNWQRIAEVEAAQDIPEQSFVSLKDFLDLDPSKLPSSLGVWLTAEDEVLDLAPHLERIQKVACVVDNFMDGRNFSQARILREQLGFDGDVRVVGNFIQDQLFFLKRCGFNEFELDETSDLDACSESLQDFSESYQAACDNAVPLFRRRS